jgi:hypothetical protein
MNEHSSRGPEPELRAGERVSLGGRVGVLRYVRGAGAVVHFDHEAGTRVVPLHRLVVCTDECRLPEG